MYQENPVEQYEEGDATWVKNRNKQASKQAKAAFQSSVGSDFLMLLDIQ